MDSDRPQFGAPPPFEQPHYEAPAQPQPQQQSTTTIQTKKGGGCLAFTAGLCTGCLFVLIVCCLCLGLCGYGCYKAFISGAESFNTDTSGEKVISEGSSAQRIMAIKVHGVITGSVESFFDNSSVAAADRICAQLKEARNDASVIGILLDMNTPGGEVVASDEIRREVDKCRQAGKKIVTFIRTMGASGGYYIASGSDWIVANPNCITGSVGVIMSGMEYHGLLDKIGVKPMVYRSGEFKDIGSGMREPTEAEQKYMQGLIDETFQNFCQVVADGRPEHFKDAEAVRKAPFGDGRPVSGKAALDYGLIDQFGDLDAAIAKTRELAGDNDAPVFKSSKLNTEFLEALLSSRSPSTLRIDGLSGHSNLKPGVMYYVMPEAI